MVGTVTIVIWAPMSHGDDGVYGAWRQPSSWALYITHRETFLSLCCREKGGLIKNDD